MSCNRMLNNYLNLKNNKECGACVKNGTVIDIVLTLAEVKKRYPVQDSTLRIWLKQENLFKPHEARMSGGTWLILQDAIERVLEEKNMFSKEYTINKEKVIGRILLLKEEIDSKHYFSLWNEEDIDSRLRFRISDYIPYKVKPVVDNILKEHFNSDFDIKDVVATSRPNILIVDKNKLYISSLDLFKMINKSKKVSQEEKDALNVLLKEYYEVKKLMNEGKL